MPPKEGAIAERPWFEKLVEKYRDDPEFVAQQLGVALMEQVTQAMERKGLNRSELADRIGVSKPYVTRLLNGSPNMTLKTIASLAIALDAYPEVRLKARRDRQEGIDRYPACLTGSMIAFDSLTPLRSAAAYTRRHVPTRPDDWLVRAFVTRIIMPEGEHPHGGIAERVQETSFVASAA